MKVKGTLMEDYEEQADADMEYYFSMFEAAQQAEQSDAVLPIHKRSNAHELLTDMEF